MFNKNFIKFLFIICLTISSFSFSEELTTNFSDTVVRAAIDIGSGATKLKVALVNIKTQKIEKVLVNESFTVQYQEELEKSTNNTFNEAVMNTGIAAIKKSKEIALQYGAKKVIGVATASFRKAANVDQYVARILRETDVQVHIIDQQLEGILGFKATTAQLQTAVKDVVVWDIGGGSFQFSTLDQNGEVLVYRGEDASIPFKNHVLKAIKLEDPSHTNTPNPLNKGQMQQAQQHARQLAQKVDRVFKEKLSDPQTCVVGIGNIFAYGIYPLVEKQTPFKQVKLSTNVDQLENKSDIALGGGDYVNVSVTNPLLVLGFMQALGINTMEIADVNNADGALLHNTFWQ